MHNVPIIKVASTSRTSLVAGCIAKTIRARGCVQIRGIGAGAAHQATRAIAAARKYLQPDHIDIATFPSYFDTLKDSERKTGLTLAIELR